ncbi:MAG TPA: TetR family transcriptional regulator C-terminal domain-containing protein [Candidatus Dormibacteraeota bacterium]
MPKQVDQRARRRQIADAVWSVIADRGLESVSLRQVAAAAGVSVGLVQHYFGDKDEMVLFALGSMTHRVDARLSRGMVALRDQADARALVRAVLVELLPLDHDRAVEARVASAFLARAAVDPGVSAHLQEKHSRRHEFLASQLRCCGVKHPEQAASLLVALVDGLTLHTLAGHQTPDSALATLDDELDRLLEGGAARSTPARSDGHVARREAVAAARPMGGVGRT